MIVKGVEFACTAVALALCVCNAFGKTVALWPVECVESNGGIVIDGRCAIDAQDDLRVFNPSNYPSYPTHGATLNPSGIGWNLPPNPDGTATMLFEPLNRTFVAGYLYSPVAGRHLAPTKSFTIEGFVRLNSLPGSDDWWILAVLGNASDNRILLTLRNGSGEQSGYSWQIVSGGHVNGDSDHVLSTISAEDAETLTTGWHHWALVYDFAQGGVCTYSFYVDGAHKGDYSAQLRTDFAMEDNRLELGGRIRKARSEKVINGSIDYVRISDAALDSSEFLCAGGAGRLCSSGSVVAYWRLGQLSEGGVDGSPSFGSAGFSGGFLGSSGNYLSILSAEEDCAFAGTPPNGTVSLADGNVGSFSARSASIHSYALVTGIGRTLALTNDFTIEGWIKPQRRDVGRFSSVEDICGTRLSNIGWCLQLAIDATHTKLRLHVQDKSGVLVDPTNDLGELTGREHEWSHIAISHDADGGTNGRGLWTCFINGQVSCTFENTRAVDADTVFGDNFNFFLQETSSQALQGNLDCWRVSSSVLSADQLMCSENGRAADGVLALWPMNSVGGAYLDGRDVVGSYHIEETPRSETYRAVATDDTPPQVDVACGSGSAGFRGFGGDNAYLLAACPSVYEAMNSSNERGFTFEAWLKLSVDTPSSWNVIFINADRRLLGNQPKAKVTFSYRSNGFVIWTASGLSDVPFRDDQGGNILLEKDVWTHVALRYNDYGSEANHVWELFVNGMRRSSIEDSKTNPAGSALYLGGRPSSANSFQGKIACVRIASGILDPSEFLCSKIATVPQTLAFWPIDSENGVLDLDSRMPTPWHLTADGTVAGTSDRARPRVPRPDSSASFIGDPSSNVGSATLGSASSLVADAIGARADLQEPFTVEGWLRRDQSAAGCLETVCGTWDGSCGWRLVIDAAGETPAFRIQAKGGGFMTKLIDAPFAPEAVSALDGAWHHVALSYDPTVGRGLWSLYVDGRAAGQAGNWWDPSGARLSGYAHAFRVGSVDGGADAVSMVGGFDCWRISSGVLAPSDFLYAHPAGFTLIFR